MSCLPPVLIPAGQNTAEVWEGPGSSGSGTTLGREGGGIPTNPQGRVTPNHVRKHLYAFKNKNQNANLLICRKKGEV